MGSGTNYGRLWRVLRNIYKQVVSSVLLGDTRTAWFWIEVGLRQGCILSPILFNLFINDLRDIVQDLGKEVKFGDGRVSVLFFADDIVVLAESKVDLDYVEDNLRVPALAIFGYAKMIGMRTRLLFSASSRFCVSF